MKPIKTKLHIEWDDGSTVEIRPFPSIRKAQKYVKRNGLTNYTMFRD